MAFTLLELLLAIGLIALLSGVGLIAGSVTLLSDKPVFPQEVFWQASHAARKTALLDAAGAGGHDVRLSYDDKQKAFVADDGVAPQTFLIAKPLADSVVQFLPAENGGARRGAGCPDGRLGLAALRYILRGRHVQSLQRPAPQRQERQPAA